ncbi:MAG: hypothetical protein AAGA85_03450 [Bacteroidota bacterium]
MIILIVLQVTLFIVAGIFFALNKEEIHQEMERVLAEDVIHGDSLRIGDLDYQSTLLLQPKIKMDEVKIWGKQAQHLSPAFDIDHLTITVSWRRLLKTIWYASEWSWSRPFLLIRNDLLRIDMAAMHVDGGVITMTKTSEGNNHRLFRPPQERIEKFFRGEQPMAGGFEIGRFKVSNVQLNYYKDISGNPEEGLPKKYDVLIRDMSMHLSSDSIATYFEDVEIDGHVGSILVKNNEGLVGRPFLADGNATLLKLSLAQKMQEDTGFDLITENFNFQFNDLEVAANGIISSLNERMRMEINFQSETGSDDKSNEALLSFLELTLSDRFLGIIKSYNPLGELEFDGKVFSKDFQFGGDIRIDLAYKARDTSFELQFFEDGERHTIDNLEFTGDFRVGGGPSYLSANITEGELYEGQRFEGTITLDNVFRRELLDSVTNQANPALFGVAFHSPNVDFPKMLRLLEFEDFDIAEGTIDFDRFYFSGPITSLSNSYADLDYGGNLVLRDIQFETEQIGLPIPLKLNDAAGRIAFNQAYVNPELSFVLNDYPLSITSGSIRDFVAFLFSEDDRIVLEDFRINAGPLNVKELIHAVPKPDSATTITLDEAFARSILDKVKRYAYVKDLQVASYEVNMDSLFEMEGVAGMYPKEMEDVSLSATINVAESVDILVQQASIKDTLAVDIRMTEAPTLAVSADLKAQITDIADWACRWGMDFGLGTHMAEPLSFKADVGIDLRSVNGRFDLYLDSGPTLLYNEELDINAQILDMEGVLRLRDNRIEAPMSFQFAAGLGDEVMAIEMNLTKDTLVLTTPGAQELDLRTAKKYLSLICPIDQNLSRLENLEGKMTFDFNLNEHRGAKGLNVLLSAQRSGSLGLEGLRFDFLKGDDVISFSDLSGDFDYNNDRVRINRFSGKYETADFEIVDSEMEDLLGFILLGNPIKVDTLHLNSKLLDLTSILSSTPAFEYTCEQELATQDEREASLPTQQCPSCLSYTLQRPEGNEEEQAIAFSLINFLKSSRVTYADANIDRILFRPIVGGETFEIDQFRARGSLNESMLQMQEMRAQMYEGIIVQNEPLNVFVKSADTLVVSGAYSVDSLQLHEVIENLNGPAVDNLKRDLLDFRGKLSMEFDFVDTLTGSTDISSLEMRIKNMEIVEGAARELALVGMDDRWKENVGPLKRFVAAFFLGGFDKKFNRPTEYVVSLKNMVLDTGWVTFDLFEFYNNQINVIATGSYELESGHRDVDLLLQRREKGYDYSQFVSTYCKNGFLTYFNVQDRKDEITYQEPSEEEKAARDARYRDCLERCPCATDDCETTCEALVPALTPRRVVPNKISFRTGKKRLKDLCKAD